MTLVASDAFVSPTPGVAVRAIGRTFVVEINRPEVRNAVDRPTAEALCDAFVAFDADDRFDVAILTGAHGYFCAGADLQAVATGRGNRVVADLAERGPMGPTRLCLSKPVIAAIEGYAVAGGLELAAWCDLRVVASDATFGVFCRRFGVPLVDGGAVRLPRLIGQSRALDLVLTGRAVGAEEALAIGLANRVCASGQALDTAIELAEQLGRFPQTCLRNDRAVVLAQWGLPEGEALLMETVRGLDTLASGEALAGAARFQEGAGRGGSYRDL